MMRAIYSVLLRILPRDKIPPLPSGMLSGEYESLDRDERRVMARYGARDPRGIRVAMAKRGVNTVDELIAQLEHHRAKREIKHRINNLICAWQNASDTDPNLEAIRRTARDARRAARPEYAEVRLRLKRALKQMDEA